MAAVTGSGLANPAAAYLPIASGDATAEAFSAACGARPVAELVVEEAGVRVECHVLDYGPGGLLAFQRAAVYRELGLRPPTLEAVREALRNYGSPDAAGGERPGARRRQPRRACRGGARPHRPGGGGGFRQLARRGADARAS